MLVPAAPWRYGVLSCQRRKQAFTPSYMLHDRSMVREMTNKSFPTPGPASLIVGTAFIAALAGCATERPVQRTSGLARPVAQPPAVIVYQDDYDYYPGYEVYYSRTRREYVYREGRQWVRRPMPPGVPVEVLSASLSVRVDFRDSPEHHHARIVQSYPRNWTPANQRWGYRERPQVQLQGTVVSGNDYDYFPGHETYYHPGRREYVYYDGRAWVRQLAPRGIAPDVLLASPSVRLEFQDPPEQHHANVVRTYPKSWVPPGHRRDDKDDRRDDRKNDRKPDNRRD